MDTVRLVLDSNGNPVPVAALDYASRERTTLAANVISTVTPLLDRGTYLFQVEGAPIWYAETPTGDNVIPEFHDGAIMFPGERTIYVTPGRRLVVKNNQDFGRVSNDAVIEIVLVPYKEV